MNDLIHEVPRRETVQVYLPQGKILEGPIDTPVKVFLDPVETEAPIVGAVVNGSLRELTYSIEMDARVRPVTMGEADGMRIYRRSLTFLLAAAFEPLFPDAHLTVDHSVSSGGYYCEVSGCDPLTKKDLKKVEQKMWELVEADIPFAKSYTPLKDAIEHFQRLGFNDKARLLAHRRKPHLVLYQLASHRDYHHGYMVPSSGYLKWFGLEKTGDGFTLRFPRRHRPTELLPMPEYPKLLATFQEYGDWLEALGISSIGALNDAIVNGRDREAVLVSEALHEGRISEIAGMIAKQHEEKRIVLVAGPSASGKTTFSKRLSIQLMARGLSPFPLELDNFFVDRDRTPRDETGEFDFESLKAIDLERLNKDLKGLIRGDEVQLPKFNFIKGKTEAGSRVRLTPGQIIILEGIHGLNPELLPDVPDSSTFRVYVSALTQLNLDRLNRVSTTDTRLIRRIVRDASQRGYSAVDTIRRWNSVRRGEKRYIFPFQENADVMFNSALMYEGSALAALAEPLIRQVPYGTEEHIEAKRLLAFLEWFLPLDTELIPDNSILREFIGGSNLKDFHPWRAP